MSSVPCISSMRRSPGVLRGHGSRHSTTMVVDRLLLWQDVELPRAFATPWRHGRRRAT